MRHLKHDAQYSGDRKERMTMATRRMKAIAGLGAMVLAVPMLFTVTSASAAGPLAGRPQFTDSYVLFTPGDPPFGQFDEAAGLQGIGQQSGKPDIVAKQPDIIAKQPDLIAKQLGSPKSPEITLKRGTSWDGGKALVQWQEMLVHGQLEKARKTVSLSVMDGSGHTMRTYTLHNAWPSRIEWTGPAGQTYLNVTLQAESITQYSPKPCAAKLCGNIAA